MKTAKLIVSVFTAVMMMIAAADASAQVATKEQRKEIQKHEKVLNKAMKQKAIKDARKEAKRLKKEGYMALTGQLPLDKQLENSWQAAYELDAQGYAYYIMSTQRAVAGNFTAAQMQAMNAAKTEIAGMIETRINQVIETKVTSNELGRNEAESLNTFVATSKNIISTTLGRVIKLVEIYREPKKTKSVEVQVTLAYNAEIATREAINALQKSLGADDVEIMKQLEVLVTE